MNAALLSMGLPLGGSLLLLLLGPRVASRVAAGLILIVSLASLAGAGLALQKVTASGPVLTALGGWESPLGIRLRLSALSALLLVFTALLHTLVALYSAAVNRRVPSGFWSLSSFLHGSLAALWLSADLFNFYVTLELLSLTAVALVALAGPRAWKPALNYLLLSLGASLFYLLGVALFYARYGILDTGLLAEMTQDDGITRLALLLMTAGLMLKAALWPLHLWLPPAHAAAPTPVSALLSSLVVKAPLFILWTLWSQLAPEYLARQLGPVLAVAGMLALTSGGVSSMRAPYIKQMVAYSTVAQLGYALMALGLMLAWQDPRMNIALWLFVIAHGLAKTSLFLAAGELQHTLGTQRVVNLRGATQTAPLAMFAFAVAGGSLIGLPPSGGFLAKWVLLGPLLEEPEHWPWAVGVLLGTLVSAAYVFRVVVLGFDKPPARAREPRPERAGHWFALLPALLVWGMALTGQWLTRILATGGL